VDNGIIEIACTAGIITRLQLGISMNICGWLTICHQCEAASWNFQIAACRARRFGSPANTRHGIIDTCAPGIIASAAIGARLAQADHQIRHRKYPQNAGTFA
jgi:hypothetical protein